MFGIADYGAFVAALLTAYPAAFRAVQWAGAAYLAWLGFRMRANPRIRVVLERLAGVFLIGFGVKLAISQ